MNWHLTPCVGLLLYESCPGGLGLVYPTIAVVVSSCNNVFDPYVPLRALMCAHTGTLIGCVLQYANVLWKVTVAAYWYI